MKRIASTLFVNTPGSKVTSQSKALVVRSPASSTRVPLEAIDGVVLIGGASITSDAIGRCVSSGIRVAALTRGGKVKFTVDAAQAGNVHLRLAQLRHCEDSALAFAVAKAMVASKLFNSRRLVQRWSWDAEPDRTEVLRACADRIEQRRQVSHTARDGDHLRGIEGDAARTYFKAMGAHLYDLETGVSMVGRSRRPPRDAVNAALSFGYGLLTAELVGAAQAVGLDSQIGFLHAVRSGRPALALDLLEEFRAQIVDRFVVGAFRRRQLRLEHFQETLGGGWYLNEAGRRWYFEEFERFREREVDHRLFAQRVPRWTLPVSQMAVLARYLRADLPCYVPWVDAS